MHTSRKLTTQDLCAIAVMTAVTAILAQIQIPMPGGVPFTLQTFAILLAGILLGPKKGFWSIFIYVFLGLCGAPVLAGFSGGFQNLYGYTGGFLVSFPLLALFAGLGTTDRTIKVPKYIGFLLLGMAVNYLCGIAVFCWVAGVSVQAGILSCMVPFLLPDAIKGVLALVLGSTLRKRLPGQLTA